MTDRTLIKDCLFYIRTTDYVSFAELERWLTDRGVDVAGDYAIEPLHNVIIWGGVSKQFCDIFFRLRPHLHLEPCSSLLVYMIDGKLMRFPVARRPPRNGYKDPHWLPVTLRAKQPPTRAEIRAGLIQDALAGDPQ